MPPCIDTSDASVFPQCDHPYRPCTLLGRLTDLLTMGSSDFNYILGFGHFSPSVFTCTCFARPCTGVPTCMNTLDASDCVPLMRSSMPLMHVARASNRSNTYARYYFFLYTHWWAISTYFHLHEYRAAVYGRADLHRYIGCFGVPPMRSFITLMNARRSGK